MGTSQRAGEWMNLRIAVGTSLRAAEWMNLAVGTSLRAVEWMKIAVGTSPLAAEIVIFSRFYARSLTRGSQAYRLLTSLCR